MAGHALRALWAERRPPYPPVRVWRDRVLLAALVAWSVVETILRDDLAWRPVALAVSIVVAMSLLWRRTRPLGAVTVAFGLLAAADVARILTAEDGGLTWSTAVALVLPYSLFRWGSGREAVIGLGFVLSWLALTQIADPTDAVTVVAGFAFFLLSAALGAAIRFYANARIRDIGQAKLRQRNQLARELHDTVGHHVSAIAIQAQAGRIAAAPDPDRALAALETIEEAASRTLEEMRAMVGVLRDGAEPEHLAPPRGVGDLERLARDVGGSPRVAVHRSGDLDDLNPSVGVALYRIAQEAVTNSVRHARSATRIDVHVTDEGDQVRLTVHDDGDAGGTGHSPGYGLLGMTERVTLLGGTLRASPDPEGGWTVEAMLPRPGAAR